MKNKKIILFTLLTMSSIGIFIYFEFAVLRQNKFKIDEKKNETRKENIDFIRDSSSIYHDHGESEKKINNFFSDFLTVYDLKIPLLFSDNVSSDLKQFILEDFNVLFASSRDYETYDLDHSNIETVDVNGANLPVTKRMFFLSLRLPRILHEQFGEIVDQNGTEKIYISSEIITAYEEAFLLVEKYAFEFNELEKFVQMITEATEDEPFTIHPKEVFFMPGSPVLDRLEREPSLVKQAQKFYSKTTRVRMPSVLEFSEIMLEDQNDGIYLNAKGYSLEGEPEVPTVETGFVYHNRRWKIIGSPGM